MFKHIAYIWLMMHISIVAGYYEGFEESQCQLKPIVKATTYEIIKKSVGYSNTAIFKRDDDSSDNIHSGNYSYFSPTMPNYSSFTMNYQPTIIVDTQPSLSIPHSSGTLTMVNGFSLSPTISTQSLTDSTKSVLEYTTAGDSCDSSCMPPISTYTASSSEALNTANTIAPQMSLSNPSSRYTSIWKQPTESSILTQLFKEASTIPDNSHSVNGMQTSLTESSSNPSLGLSFGTVNSHNSMSVVYTQDKSSIHNTWTRTSQHSPTELELLSSTRQSSSLFYDSAGYASDKNITNTIPETYSLKDMATTSVMESISTPVVLSASAHSFTFENTISMNTSDVSTVVSITTTTVKTLSNVSTSVSLQQSETIVIASSNSQSKNYSLLTSESISEASFSLKRPSSLNKDPSHTNITSSRPQYSTELQSKISVSSPKLVASESKIRVLSSQGTTERNISSYTPSSHLYELTHLESSAVPLMSHSWSGTINNQSSTKKPPSTSVSYSTVYEDTKVSSRPATSLDDNNKNKTSAPVYTSEPIQIPTGSFAKSVSSKVQLSNSTSLVINNNISSTGIDHHVPTTLSQSIGSTKIPEIGVMSSLNISFSIPNRTSLLLESVSSPISSFSMSVSKTTSAISNTSSTVKSAIFSSTIAVPGNHTSQSSIFAPTLSTKVNSTVIWSTPLSSDISFNETTFSSHDNHLGTFSHSWTSTKFISNVVSDDRGSSAAIHGSSSPVGNFTLYSSQSSIRSFVRENVSSSKHSALSVSSLYMQSSTVSNSTKNISSNSLTSPSTSYTSSTEISTKISDVLLSGSKSLGYSTLYPSHQSSGSRRSSLSLNHTDIPSSAQSTSMLPTVSSNKDNPSSRYVSPSDHFTESASISSSQSNEYLSATNISYQDVISSAPTSSDHSPTKVTKSMSSITVTSKNSTETEKVHSHLYSSANNDYTKSSLSQRSIAAPSNWNSNTSSHMFLSATTVSHGSQLSHSSVRHFNATSTTIQDEVTLSRKASLPPTTSHLGSVSTNSLRSLSHLSDLSLSSDITVVSLPVATLHSHSSNDIDVIGSSTPFISASKGTISSSNILSQRESIISSNKLLSHMASSHNSTISNVMSSSGSIYNHTDISISHMQTVASQPDRSLSKITTTSVSTHSDNKIDTLTDTGLFSSEQSKQSGPSSNSYSPAKSTHVSFTETSFEQSQSKMVTASSAFHSSSNGSISFHSAYFSNNGTRMEDVSFSLLLSQPSATSTPVLTYSETANTSLVSIKSVHVTSSKNVSSRDLWSHSITESEHVAPSASIHLSNDKLSSDILNADPSSLSKSVAYNASITNSIPEISRSSTTSSKITSSISSSVKSLMNNSATKHSNSSSSKGRSESIDISLSETALPHASKKPSLTVNDSIQTTSPSSIQISSKNTSQNSSLLSKFISGTSDSVMTTPSDSSSLSRNITTSSKVSFVSSVKTVVTTSIKSIQSRLISKSENLNHYSGSTLPMTSVNVSHSTDFNKSMSVSTHSINHNGSYWISSVSTFSLLSSSTVTTNANHTLSQKSNSSIAHHAISSPTAKSHEQYSKSTLVISASHSSNYTFNSSLSLRYSQIPTTTILSSSQIPSFSKATNSKKNPSSSWYSFIKSNSSLSLQLSGTVDGLSLISSSRNPSGTGNFSSKVVSESTFKTSGYFSNRSFALTSLYPSSTAKNSTPSVLTGTSYTSGPSIVRSANTSMISRSIPTTVVTFSGLKSSSQAPYYNGSMSFMTSVVRPQQSNTFSSGFNASFSNVSMHSDTRSSRATLVSSFEVDPEHFVSSKIIVSSFNSTIPSGEGISTASVSAYSSRGDSSSVPVTNSSSTTNLYNNSSIEPSRTAISATVSTSYITSKTPSAYSNASFSILSKSNSGSSQNPQSWLSTQATPKGSQDSLYSVRSNSKEKGGEDIKTSSTETIKESPTKFTTITTFITASETVITSLVPVPQETQTVYSTVTTVATISGRHETQTITVPCSMQQSYSTITSFITIPGSTVTSVITIPCTENNGVDTTSSTLTAPSSTPTKSIFYTTFTSLVLEGDSTKTITITESCPHNIIDGKETDGPGFTTVTSLITENGSTKTTTLRQPCSEGTMTAPTTANEPNYETITSVITEKGVTRTITVTIPYTKATSKPSYITTSTLSTMSTLQTTNGQIRTIIITVTVPYTIKATEHIELSRTNLESYPTAEVSPETHDILTINNGIYSSNSEPETSTDQTVTTVTTILGITKTVTVTIMRSKSRSQEPTLHVSVKNPPYRNDSDYSSSNNSTISSVNATSINVNSSVVSNATMYTYLTTTMVNNGTILTTNIEVPNTNIRNTTNTTTYLETGNYISAETKNHTDLAQSQVALVEDALYPTTAATYNTAILERYPLGARSVNKNSDLSESSTYVTNNSVVNHYSFVVAMVFALSIPYLL